VRDSTVETNVRLRLQWLAISVLAALSTALPAPLRSTCLVLADGAAVALRVDVLAKVAARYVSTHPSGRSS
jgi:hypothetical protein